MRGAEGRTILLGALGTALVAAFAVMASVSGLQRHVGVFLVVYAVAFALYAAAVFVVLRSPVSRGALLWIVGAAVAARLVLVPATPVMSTDVYRYLWEGREITAGFNPFAHAPEDPELSPLRDADYEGVTYKDMETIYPPVAQGVFALAALAHPKIWMQKLVFVLFDIATVLLLLRLLRERGLDPARAVVYAWSPLAIFETGHSGHVDAVGVCFMVLAFVLIARPHRATRAWAFVAFALSFLAKYVVVVLAPFFALRRRYALWLVLAAAIVVAAFVPFVGAGSKLFASLHTYSNEWRFNALAYRLATSVWDHPLAVRRILGAAALVCIVVAARRHDDVVRFAGIALGCTLLAVPTLYPWYVIWIVPVLCVFPERSWILFTGLLALSYLVWPIFDRTGQWRLPAWVLWAEYGPFLALMAFDMWRRRGREVAA